MRDAEGLPRFCFVAWLGFLALAASCPQFRWVLPPFLAVHLAIAAVAMMVALVALGVKILSGLRDARAWSRVISGLPGRPSPPAFGPDPMWDRWIDG